MLHNYSFNYKSDDAFISKQTYSYFLFSLSKHSFMLIFTHCNSKCVNKKLLSTKTMTERPRITSDIGITGYNNSHQFNNI